MGKLEFFSSCSEKNHKIEVLKGYRPRNSVLKIDYGLYLSSSIRACFRVLSTHYFAGNLKWTIFSQKGTLAFDWNERFVTAKMKCNELYELLGTYEGSMGAGLYYSGHCEGVLAALQMNRQNSRNNWSWRDMHERRDMKNLSKT
jgi:hypothetical protein